MSSLVFNFDQILEFAQSYGLPLIKKRGILREYLQTKILDLIYREKLSANLFLVGGTGLRLLYGLDRFSEDLDFDVVKLEKSQIKELMEKVFWRLKQENMVVDFYENVTPRRAYYEFRFKDLLHELRIASQLTEKLTIKFDFETFWQRQQRELVLLNRYGFLINVVTIPLDQIVVQKLYAYLKRRQTLPRDIYDIVWLAAQGAKLDREFLRKNKLSLKLLAQAEKLFEKEKSQLKTWKLKLRPFLIDEQRVEKLALFPEALKILG